MCHKCLRPIGAKPSMTEAVEQFGRSAYIVNYHALFGTPEKKQ